MKHFALIGEKLEHSFSKEFFTNFFQLNEIDADYANIELADINEFKNVKADFNGFNVTIPYKEKIIPFLDELDPVAANVGAVNTVKRVGDKFIGYNTDVVGFANMIKPFLTNKHEKALILGTGGASKAVEFVLENLGLECFFLSRDPIEENQFDYSDVNDRMIATFKLLVNTTPVGMFPEVTAYPMIPYQFLDKDHLVIDLIYNPEETEFLKRAKEYGATVLNGSSMLKEQAIAAYRIWNE